MEIFADFDVKEDVDGDSVCSDDDGSKAIPKKQQQFLAFAWRGCITPEKKKVVGKCLNEKMNVYYRFIFMQTPPRSVRRVVVYWLRL